MYDINKKLFQKSNLYFPTINIFKKYKIFKFVLYVDSEPCKELLFPSCKRNLHRMTPTGGRSRTASETGPASTPLTSTLTSPGQDDCLEVTILDDTGDGRLPDVVAASKLCGGDEERVESYLAITIQVFIPFLVAGLGMVGAGLVLDDVQVSIFSFPDVTN